MKDFDILFSLLALAQEKIIEEDGYTHYFARFGELLRDAKPSLADRTVSKIFSDYCEKLCPSVDQEYLLKLEDHPIDKHLDDMIEDKKFISFDSSISEKKDDEEKSSDSDRISLKLKDHYKSYKELITVSLLCDMVDGFEDIVINFTKDEKYRFILEGGKFSELEPCEMTAIYEGRICHPNTILAAKDFLLRMHNDYGEKLDYYRKKPYDETKTEFKDALCEATRRYEEAGIQLNRLIIYLEEKSPSSTKDSIIGGAEIGVVIDGMAINPSGKTSVTGYERVADAARVSCSL